MVRQGQSCVPGGGLAQLSGVSLLPQGGACNPATSTAAAAIATSATIPAPAMECFYSWSRRLLVLHLVQAASGVPRGGWPAECGRDGAGHLQPEASTSPPEQRTCLLPAAASSTPL